VKTILITGATGFVGRHLVKRAFKDNYRIIVSARKSSKIKWLEEFKIPVINLSLSNPETLIEELKGLELIFQKIDVIIHNAGLTQGLNGSSYNDINYILTKNLIDAVQVAFTNKPKFLFTSSLASLGPGNSESLEKINENQTPNPVTLYGKSKLKAEQYLQKQTDIKWCIIRPTAVYGPYEKNLLTLIKAVKKGFEIYIGSKKQMLSFIYVEDLADIMINLCETDFSNKTFNLSDGDIYSTQELNQILKKIFKKKTISIVLPLGLVKIIALLMESIGKITKKATIINRDKLNELVALNWTCDISGIEKEIGFKPKYKLEQGMSKTIEWYKKNDWL